MLNKKGLKTIFLVFVLMLISLFIRGNVFASEPNFSLKIIYLPQCSDGRDNDADGKIDYPEDPDCTSVNDNKEDVDNKDTSTSSMIVIQGKTIPNAKIKILKDGKTIIYSKSDNEGNFLQSIYGFYYGNYSFGLISEAKDKTLTNINNFNVELRPGSYVSVYDVFVSPTISINKKTNSNIVLIEGYAIPESEVEIILFDKSNNKINIINNAKSNKNGYYSYELNLNNIDNGNYLIYSNNIINKNNIGKSKSLDIEILKTKENETVVNQKNKVRCDLNNDNKVDLIDFSILIFYWLSSDYKEGDFNLDNVVDIKDFSIMAFNWTGD